MKKTYEYIVEIIESDSIKNNVLDRSTIKICELSCGRGHIVKTLQDKGYNVIGINFSNFEFNSPVIRHA